jgi:dienelactone hydrolase
LIKLADYLTNREDIDPARIGITGESLGGWLNEFLKHGTFEVMI